jgi:hypothetical protein
VRDIPNSDSFWVIHAIAAYEPWLTHDHDPMTVAPGPTDPRMERFSAGWYPSEFSKAAWVFTEVVRDIAVDGFAHNWDWDAAAATWKKTVEHVVRFDAAELTQRVTYHEVTHGFGFGHIPHDEAANPGWQGVMNYPIMFGSPVAEIALTPAQLNIIRWAEAPDA